MPQVTLKIEGWECTRCTYQWQARKKQKPILCPACKSAYWDKSKKKRQDES